MDKSNAPQSVKAVVVAALAWAIPGAGHVYLGRALRGVILCLCINGLFWAGVAFGGAFTVEPLKQRWWFAAQMGTGASGLAGWYLQRQFRADVAAEAGLRTSAPPADREQAKTWWSKYTEQLARRDLALVYPTDSVARSYSGVAGMLNLLCVFDAVMLSLLGQVGEPPRPRRQTPKKEPPA